MNSVAGQWFGYFQYGPVYGDLLKGQRVLFSFLIEEKSDGSFEGKCIELNGPGASDEIARIEGKLVKNLLHFTKTYPTQKQMDHDGNITDYEGPENRLLYAGMFRPERQAFSGNWTFQYLTTTAQWTNDFVEYGTWEIGRNAADYGI